MLHRHPLLSLLTGGYLLFVAWLTLTPADMHTSQAAFVQRVLDALHRRGYVESLDYSRFELLANVALFVPVGMFLLLLFGAGGWWVAAASSFAMTAGIETLQTQIPGRVPDDRDLLANGAGALIGIAVALVLTMPETIRRHRRRQRAQRTGTVGRAGWERTTR
ncbi:MAG TPA: VanZ family protein [Nocardioides sp.]|nr:VanZ family protein [Nocardioides sp.]